MKETTLMDMGNQAIRCTRECLSVLTNQVFPLVALIAGEGMLGMKIAEICLSNMETPNKVVLSTELVIGGIVLPIATSTIMSENQQAISE